MSEYTPETEYVQRLYVLYAKTPVSNGHPDVLVEERTEQFDRWLGQLLYEAWDAGLQEGLGGGWEDNPYEEYK